MGSTPPKLPWYKKPLIVQIIAPVLIVLAVGACVGLAGVGVSQLLGGPNVFSTMASNGPAPSSVSVTILNGTGIQQSLNYQPASVTVAKGGTVTWTNNDYQIPHTVTSVSVPSGGSSFDSGQMNYTATFKVTFSVDGTYNYVCSYHPWMHGSVIVTG
ncbi:MAG TPA: plastocyanin/azurin family copper-binding protein [Candidatus Bathyarchaeia archaeon]